MSETNRMVRSTVTEDGTVRITIEEAPMPDPGPDEVVVAVEASPINPSDLGMLIAGADPATFDLVDGALVGQLTPRAVAANTARLGRPMPCGNEGAGTVIAALGNRQPGIVLLHAIDALDVRIGHRPLAVAVPGQPFTVGGILTVYGKGADLTAGRVALCHHCGNGRVPCAVKVA